MLESEPDLQTYVRNRKGCSLKNWEAKTAFKMVFNSIKLCQMPKRLLSLRCERNKMEPHSERKWNIEIKSLVSQGPQNLKLTMVSRRTFSSGKGNTLLIATLTHLVPKAAVLCEITRSRDGHWPVQGQSRSLILVPIESLYATSCYWKIPTYILSHTVSELSRRIRQIIGFGRGCLCLTPSLGVNPWTLDDKIWSWKTRSITLSCSARHISINWTI